MCICFVCVLNISEYIILLFTLVSKDGSLMTLCDTEFVFSFGKGLMTMMPRDYCYALCRRYHFNGPVKSEACQDIECGNKSDCFMCKVFIKLDENRWGNNFLGY